MPRYKKSSAENQKSFNPCFVNSVAVYILHHEARFRKYTINLLYFDEIYPQKQNRCSQICVADHQQQL